ncbi:hypothetical protein Tco_0829215, partial [Tanacetum coccineum]
KAAGYSAVAVFKCALKYAYLKEHRFSDCAFNVDEMLDEEVFL